MSIAVYEAYCLKEGEDLFKTAKIIKEVAIGHIRTELKGMYEYWMSDEEMCKKIRETFGKEKDESVKFEECGWYMLRKYGDQLNKSTSNPFHLDVVITVRELKGKYYLIPFCSGILRKTLDFLKTHPSLEPYAYWNNVDPDEDVPEEEWEKRGEIWDVITEPENWNNYLEIPILNYESFLKVDPGFELDKEQARKK